MNNKKENIIDEFLSTLITFANNLADVCPDSIIGNNITKIRNVLKNPEFRTKIIDMFVAKILIYKKEIDEGDENFFLKEKKYDDDLKDVKYGDVIYGKIFEFKNIWNQLNRKNKDTVILYMKLLCYYAQEYFMIVDC